MISRLLFPIFFALLLVSAVLLKADEAATVAPQPPPINGFQVPALDANIAPTNSMPTKAPEVFGHPKNETTHPSLLWDQEDIDHYKEMLKTSKELQIQFDVMKAKVDARIAQGLEVPDGQYLLSALPKFPNAPSTDDPAANFRRWFNMDTDIASDMATIYVLTGDEKYADFAKKLLLQWAHCREWGPVAKIQERSGAGPITGNFVEGLMMHHWAQAYDLIYNLKSWTPEERKQVHDDFFFPLADCWLYPAAPDTDKDNSGGAFVSQVNNRGLHALACVYAMGVVTDDQELIDAGLYGVHEKSKVLDPIQRTTFPPQQDWVVGTADNPGNGLLNCFFAQKAIPGGMWIEGTPGYAFYTLGSMLTAAEIGWHHGVDFYRNDNGIFKSMFDFPILLGYPDLTVPGLNDSHRESLLTGSVPVLYEYAYRRYQDPRYLTMINSPEERRFLAAIADPATAKQLEDALLNPPAPPPPGTPPPPPVPEAQKPPKSQRSLAMQSFKFGGNPPSFMYDLDPKAGSTLLPPPSVNYSLVGFGIIRTQTVSGKYPQQVILSYGPSASHGHPDKLAIDVFAMDDILVPTPGVNFPYQNPNLPKWFKTTLSHNTLMVDEKSQDYLGSNPKTQATADQTIFAPASTVGMERCWSDTAYAGVTMDRALFMTPNYLADIYGAFSSSPHKYDFAWHVRGDAASDLTFNPITFDQSINGYNWLTSARAADATDKPVNITSTRGDKVARLHLAGGTPTQTIIGEGGIYVDDTSDDPHHKPTCPTIIERRDNLTSTIYGNALDFSGSKDGYVKGVAQEGGFDKGYAMLTVTKTAGTDLCFTAYRPGSYSAGTLQTDGLQALVQMAGTEPNTLYLAGGTTLKAGNASITRSEAGLAYVEKTLDGNYIVGNPSPTPGTVKVTLPALAGLDAFTVDATGQKGGPAEVTKAGNVVTLQLAAGAMVEFAKK